MDNRETNFGPGPAYQAVPSTLADGDADERMQPLRGGKLSTRAKDLRVATMKLPPLDLAESDSEDSSEDTAVPRRKHTTKPQPTVTNTVAALAQGADTTTETGVVDVTNSHAVSPDQQRRIQGHAKENDTTLGSVSGASQHSDQQDSCSLSKGDDEHLIQRAEQPTPDTEQNGKPASFQPLSTLVS